MPRNRRDITRIMPRERNHTIGGRSMSRPHTYIVGNTTNDSASSIMGFLKGKSSLMIYERCGNMKYKYRNRQFWCRGYYIDTNGKNKKKIKNTS